MLEVVVDTNADLEPDLSVLDADFYRGQVSQLSNTSIYNGEIRRSRTWTIALMPRRTGLLTIPPIVIGTEQSEPVNINVREPSNEPPGEADVFITSELDRSEGYVQAQFLYRIKIYRAVATRQQFDPLRFQGVALILQAGHAADQGFEAAACFPDRRLIVLNLLPELA